jgi:hypothetical protein
MTYLPRARRRALIATLATALAVGALTVADVGMQHSPVVP